MRAPDFRPRSSDGAAAEDEIGAPLVGVQQPGEVGGIVGTVGGEKNVGVGREAELSTGR